MGSPFASLVRRLHSDSLGQAFNKLMHSYAFSSSTFDACNVEYYSVSFVFQWWSAAFHELREFAQSLYRLYREILQRRIGVRMAFPFLRSLRLCICRRFDICGSVITGWRATALLDKAVSRFGTRIKFGCFL